MIKIEKGRGGKKIEDIAEEFFDKINPEKIKGDYTREPTLIEGKTYQGNNAILVFLKKQLYELNKKPTSNKKLLAALEEIYGKKDHLDSLKKFLLAKPDVLKKDYIPLFEGITFSTKNGKEKTLTGEGEITNSVFNYIKSFPINWLGYELNVKVCPYCNNQYTQSLVKDQPLQKGEKPFINQFQLDHYYSQTDFPYLALCFYNLVPICPNCNGFGGKSGEDVASLDLIHPYELSFHDLVEFKTTKCSDEKIIRSLVEKNSFVANDIKVKLGERPGKSTGGALENHKKFFHLDKIYEQHSDVVCEIYNKSIFYNESRRKELTGFFKNNGFSDDELVQFILGNYVNEEDFNLRPHSKLTYDIAEQLGLLKELPVKKKVLSCLPARKQPKKWWQRLFRFIAQRLRKVADRLD